MQQPTPPIHPNIRLFISLLTDTLEAAGMKKMQEAQLVAYHLWSLGMSEPEREAILGAQQRQKIVTLITAIFTSVPIERLAHYPEEAEVAAMARIGGMNLSHKKSFEQLYKSVLEWFEWEYSLVFKNDTFKQHIFKSLIAPLFQDGNEAIFMDIMINGEIDDLSSIQPFMRAYQALTNHTFYEYQGKIFSRFSFELARNYDKYAGSRKVDLGDFFARISEGYLHIEKYFQHDQKHKEQYREEMRVRLEKWNIKEDELPSITHYHTEYAPILRHMYDWIVRMIPEKLTKIQPVEIFAVVVYALHKLYEEIGIDFLPKKFPLIYEAELKNYVIDTLQKKLVASAKEKAQFGLEVFMYVNEDTDHSFFFPVIKNEKKDRALEYEWEKLRDKYTQYIEEYGE